MRIFIIVLWLILGIVYFWVWNRGTDDCCNEGKVKQENVQQKTPGTAQEDDQKIAELNNEPESTNSNQNPTDLNKESGASNSLLNSTFPLAFNWNSPNPVLGDNFQSFKDSVLKTVADGKILEITGLFKTDEEKPSGFDNMGIARAEEIRKLFPEIPDNQIRFFGKDEGNMEGDKSRLFYASSFKSALNGDNIKEVDDVASIYFPYNSTSKLDNAKIEAYFDDVAERIMKSGEKVNLIGHTDSRGSDDSNMVLGLKRANIIKDYLLSKGVPINQISVNSGGEKSPIASNETSEGRAKNRRVDLKITKQ